MANEFVKMVAKKANLSEPIAQIAVDTVINLLKDKLPPIVGNTLDSILGSSPASSSNKPSTTSSSKTTTGSKSTKTTTTKTSPTSKNTKNDNPLGDLGSIVDTIGGLFGGKK